MRRSFLFALLAVALIGISLLLWEARRAPAPTDPVLEEAPLVALPDDPPPAEPTPLPTPEPPPPPKPAPPPKPKPVTPKPPPEVALSPSELAPPPVEIHPELIPKDIEIARIYYEQQMMAPGARTVFHINGSGFTDAFGQMIMVRSGVAEVAVEGLKLVTLNQIQGVLVVGGDAATGVGFPEILINEKVVFQAPEPFAVIRPGEVLNLVFTEMGPDGRTGRFRVFTNLSEHGFEAFSIAATTPGIIVSDLAPQPPFIVDGTIFIGGVPTGDYGISVSIADRVGWSREGIIRVIRPQVGQSGLVQQVFASERFLRPKDQASFAVSGSGFRPGDESLLRAEVPGMTVTGTFTFVAAGRMTLSFAIPDDAETGDYGLRLFVGEEDLLASENVFAVVGANWVRGLGTEPALRAGGTVDLRLDGRSLDEAFIKALRVEADEPHLDISPFKRDTSETARAAISASTAVAPGDYWLRLYHADTEIAPPLGTIIRVEPAE